MKSKQKRWSLTIHTIVYMTLMVATVCYGRPTMESLQNQIQLHQSALESLQREYEHTQHERINIANQVASSTKELQEGRVLLDTGNATSGRDQEWLQREQIQLESTHTRLAALSATLARLQQKEVSLQTSIQQRKQQLSASLDQIHQQKWAYREQLKRESESLSRDLATLRSNNKQLQSTLAEELRKVALAKAQAQKRMQSAQDEQSISADTSVPIQETDHTQASPVKDKKQDISQTVLPGELPIYQDLTDKEIVLHSRTLEQHYPMREVADNIYEADVVIDAGVQKAYFDVMSRRYRGTFPAVDKPVTYVFTLDQSHETRPKMDVKRKPNEQIVSNNDPAS